MNIPSKFESSKIEKKWNEEWNKNNCFSSEPNPKKTPYTVVIPPPNVTGHLHMGHMLNNTIQDVLVRKARMEGKEACWIPGTDHASIATEAKVVAMLEEKGVKKEQLSREQFLKEAFAWKDKYGGIILKQLKTLGASCDWKRTLFTMDKDYSKEVIKVFVDLYNKGLIYRGVRMVNWDPKSKTAVSDEEVIRKEVDSHLYYIAYQVVDEDEKLIIATTRPETIPADTAICVNPEDERYQHLIGKKVIVPISQKEVKIIADEYVDKSFGTGCLKVTPAHDINDYELGIKHHLEVIDIISEEGTLNEKAGKYASLDRFDARKEIIKDFKKQEILVKEESIKNNIGFSERTHVVIEPKLSMQWFVKMKEFSAPALENVENGNIKLHPEKYINTYRHWMNNIRDWCISRQLWWGHQIPVWYLPNGTYVVAENFEEALQKAKKEDKNITAEDLTQDSDVLDTWASSWLWPISAFKGISNPNNEEFQYYYPTDDLVTAPDILFFWVARMIIAGYEYTKKPPFKNVYLTGMVRDKQRRKMSKSLGNSPDPLDIIQQYGADGVRVGMLLCSPAGNDLLFDEKLVEQGRNFANKIWNAFRLIQGWEMVECREEQTDESKETQTIHSWMDAKINFSIKKIEHYFEQYRISDALMVIYKLIWNDFCSVYLEMIKPPFGEKISKKDKVFAQQFLDKLLRLLHPFMPFLTEEVWQHNKTNLEEINTTYLTISEWPKFKDFNETIIDEGQLILEVISKIRDLRTTYQIAPKEILTLSVKTPHPQKIQPFEFWIQKMGFTSPIQYISAPIVGTQTIVADKHTFFVMLEGVVDLSKEKEKLEKEITYLKGFKASVEKKLNNDKFVNNAPAQVVENERKKLSDAEGKIKEITQSLSQL